MSNDLPPAFRRQLRKIDKKHRGTTTQVNGILADIAAGGPPPKARQIPGLQGAPVFKLRFPIRNAGTQSGRLIFHYDGGLLVPLFVFPKADLEDVALSEIRNALTAAGLARQKEPPRAPD